MAPVSKIHRVRTRAANAIIALSLALVLAVPSLPAQSGQSQTPAPAPAQPAQDIPDAPSTVQPPPPSKTIVPPSDKPNFDKMAEPPANPVNDPSSQPPDSTAPAAATTSPSTTSIPASAGPRNQIDPSQGLYKISVPVNFVQIPVMVTDKDGRRIEGLLPKDFSVYENGKKQTLSFFTSDPYQLSVAVLIDISMPDVALQKVNQTYGALIGAFSPYDEVALYTYSSTVSEVTDFTGPNQRLTAALNQLKEVRGHNNGPPVMDGPMASGPIINGAPAGGPILRPVNTPPRESHVLNDAILRAALDLSKRGKTNRKVIFVISDGRELGSKASYGDVLRVLETRDIQVKAVALDAGALPGFRQLGKIHLKDQGYGDILPKYANATGGGQVRALLSRNAIEDAYAEITSEARNQYTLGYVPKAVAGTASPYRDLEVRVAHPGLKVITKDGYYPISSSR